MSANTLASALAAARKCSLPPAVQAQSIRVSVQTVHATRAPVAVVPSVAAVAATPAIAAVPAVLSNADALMIAIQRSARTVDDIMTRRMLLASGCLGIGDR